MKYTSDLNKGRMQNKNVL